MKHFLRLLGSVLFIFCLITLRPTPAVAAPSLQQLGGNTINVSAPESVESIVALGTDVQIFGTVSDVILVINGNVLLGPTAKVDLVIDLGGHVTNQTTNKIRDGIFELNFTQQILNNLFIGGSLLFVLWFIRLSLSLAGIVLLTSLGFLLKKRLNGTDTLISTSILRMFGIGTAVFVVVSALAVLLTLTVVGIPLAAILLFLSLIAALWGSLPVIKFFGERVLSQEILQYPELTGLLIQSIIIVSLANLPLLGPIFLAIIGLIGLGLALTSGVVYLKQRKIGPRT